MNNILEETKFLLKKYGISANKKLGQNFLIDENVLDTILSSADITKEDLIIEIGPGLGTLTSKLLEKAGEVICIEIDGKMINILKDRFFMYNNFKIINKDVLKIDFNSLIGNNKNNVQIKNVKIVANLPYYITTPIIMKLLEEKLDIQTITVMVQKEVADRLTAIPGNKNCGAITYTVYYYAEAEKILTVPNVSFIPEPEVTSEIIKLNLRKKPIVKVANEKEFFKLIKIAFMQRRKTLVNAISNVETGVNKQKVEEVLQKLNIDRKARAETLTIEQFAKIQKNILKD